MVREFNLPWQPVSKLKNRGEISNEDYPLKSFTTNYYQCLDKNEEDSKDQRSWLTPSGSSSVVRCIPKDDGNKTLSKDQTKVSKKKLQNLIEDISKTLSGQKI